MVSSTLIRTDGVMTDVPVDGRLKYTMPHTMALRHEDTTEKRAIEDVLKEAVKINPALAGVIFVGSNYEHIFQDEEPWLSKPRGTNPAGGHPVLSSTEDTRLARTDPEYPAKSTITLVYDDSDGMNSRVNSEIEELFKRKNFWIGGSITPAEVEDELQTWDDVPTANPELITSKR